MSYLLTGDIPDELRDAILEMLRTNKWTAVERLPGSVKVEFGEPPMASGGAVGGPMPYLVGEQGPEIFVPRASTSGTVTFTVDGKSLAQAIVYASNTAGGLPIRVRPE